MSLTLGKKNSSNGVLNGTGVSGAAILMIGPSRLSKHSLGSNAATSAPVTPVLLASWYGVDGATSLRPGEWKNQPSGHSEWNGPPCTPPPNGARITKGTGAPQR